MTERRRLLLASGVLAGIAVISRGATAGPGRSNGAADQGEREPDLEGNAQIDRPPERPGDEIFPTPVPVASGALRAAFDSPRACSFRAPVCVHFGSPGALLPDLVRRALLTSLDRACGAVRVMGYPVPALAVAIAHGEKSVSAVVLDRNPLARFESLRVGLTVDPDWLRAAGGCERDVGIAEGVLRAIALSVSPGTDGVTATGGAAYVASLIGPGCPGLAAPAPYFEAAHGAALPRAEPFESAAADESYARGSGLFFAWLDRTFTARPGGMVRAMMALTPAHIWGPLDDGIFGAPDGYDVLRYTFRDYDFRGSSFDEELLHFSIERVAPSSPWWRSLGAPAKVAPLWSIGWPVRPRRLVGTPIEPTGMDAVIVHRAGAKRGARLRIEAEWEERAHLRLAAVKLDATGTAKSIVALTGRPKAPEAQATIDDLDTASDIAVVAVNMGDDSVKGAFEPSHRVWEPHGWMVTLTEE